MPSKRPSDGDSEGTPSKIARSDQSDDFSGSVRKKLTGTSRTGQACDRCKIRKIRCDARPGGCSPCLQNNLECKTTDRITGRATSRGHTEHIEAENIALKQYVNDLRTQLQENGIEARQSPMIHAGYIEAGGSPGFGWSQQMFDLSLILKSDGSDKIRARGSVLPDFRTGSLGDNYLGTSGANEWLSPIKGTSLALFGMELDLADYITNDTGEAFSPTSYEEFLTLALQGQSQEAPTLPPYQECKAFCEWYFKSINCHAPIVHKPALIDMVDRLHTDGNFQPSIAETVQLHMILAMMLFQYSIRNGVPNEWAKHYRYAASFLPKLITERTLASMQAIALICLHLRNFTKPGGAWFMTNLTLALCVEMGFHRSVTAWSKSIPEMEQSEIELRKRVFWSVMVIHCSLSNKLGRPLAVRLEDFDVELPKPIDDHIDAEEPIDDWHKCSYRVALYNFKWVLLNIQVQTSMYSVRAPPHSYELTLQCLERDLDTFMKTIPIELSGGSQTAQDDRVCSLYLQFGAQELNLLIHHPAVCRTSNPDTMNRNLDQCLEASSKLLKIAVQMRSLRSLDTTWLNATVWLSAMFVTLFTYSQRKDQMTSADLSSLKESMYLWLTIIGDIGQMLGSGPRLQEAVRHIVDAAINIISRHLAAKTASAAVASVGLGRSSPPAIDGPQDTQAYSSSASFPTNYTTDQTASTNGATSGPHLPAEDHTVAPQPAPYPAGNFAYPDPSGTTVPAYPSNSLPFDTGAYDNGDDIKPDLSAQLIAHNAGHSLTAHQQHQAPRRQGRGMSMLDQMASNFQNAFGANAFSGVQVPQPQHQQQQQQQNLSGPAAWRHFTHDMMGSMSMPGYDLSGADALVALGQKNGEQNLANAGSALGMQLPNENGVHEGLWPLMTYGPVLSHSGTGVMIQHPGPAPGPL